MARVIFFVLIALVIMVTGVIAVITLMTLHLFNNNERYLGAAVGWISMVKGNQSTLPLVLAEVNVSFTGESVNVSEIVVDGLPMVAMATSPNNIRVPVLIEPGNHTYVIAALPRNSTEVSLLERIFNSTNSTEVSLLERIFNSTYVVHIYIVTNHGYFNGTLIRIPSKLAPPILATQESSSNEIQTAYYSALFNSLTFSMSSSASLSIPSFIYTLALLLMASV